ncbi:hypothetical protein ACLMJK_008807 [Lecanora helva]
MTKPVHKDRLCNELLNNVVDRIAKVTPDSVYAELPRSPVDLSQGFRQVTYRDFANAINGIAWFLRTNLGPSETFETLTYIGPNDLRHNLLLLGSVKAGYKMLCTSPRYSSLGQVHLMKLVDCKTMLVPSERPPVIDSILKEYEMRMLEIPELDELLGHSYPDYPFDKKFADARNGPLVVLHTSGTTGLPKPIIWTHDWAASFGGQRQLIAPPGFELCDDLLLRTRILSLMPPFHAGHLFASLLFTILCGTVIIYPLSTIPPSAQMASECLEYTTATALTLVPPYVEEIGRDPELLKRLSAKVNCIFWAGGDISLAAGNNIAAKTKLFTTCGSTEMGMWPTIRPKGGWTQEHWKYMRIHPAANVSFRHQSNDLYEAFMVRNINMEDEQPIFKVFPGHQEFSSGDLFSPHAADPELWQYRGRSDDLQTFSSGEKYHPVVVEQRLARSPDIEGALLVGTGRPKAALLLEIKRGKPQETPQQREDILLQLWPLIEEVNTMCPTYAKITRDLTLILSPARPMARAAKGTVQRSATVALYEKELDMIFARSTTFA